MRVPEPPDLVGHTIASRYTVEAVLGQGGQGVVYRARENEGGRVVAIKMLSLLAARDPQSAQRFLREQAALQALVGTAAVQVLDAGETPEGSLYLVLEFLDGRDLEQELGQLEERGERMEPSRIAELIEPVAATLDAAHAQGIVHRDLKPANVFLLREGGVRLLDFGFARLRSSRPLTAVGTVMGSPCYIAPEVWRGRPELVDHRADLYSLAILLFRMLSGELPFESPELVTVLKLATTGSRPSLHALRPDLPDRVDVWVERALAIDREQRFASAGACVQELFACLGAAAALAASRSAQRGQSQQLAAAADRVARVLHDAAAALKRWTVGRADAGAKPAKQAREAKGAKKPRTRTQTDVKGTRKRTGKTLPNIPKLAPAKPHSPAAKQPPPPPGAKRARPLAPPSRTRPGGTVPAAPPAAAAGKPTPPLARGKLPPPPAAGRKRTRH